MKPEDLGIKAFKPAPDPKAELARKAVEVDVRTGDLVRAAERIANDSIALKSALERSRGTIQRLGIENVFLKRALEEARRHRALLFWIGLVLVVLLLLRR